MPITQMEDYYHRPNSQSPPITLVVCTSILALLTGATLTCCLFGLIFFTPVLIIFSPVWIPVASVVLVLISGFLLACGLSVAALVAAIWVFKCFRGWRVVEPARSRIFYTAREYGGRYLQTKVKDVAPSA